LFSSRQVQEDFDALSCFPLRESTFSSDFAWMWTVNPIRYVAGSLYLTAETGHTEKGHLKHTERQARDVETAEFAQH